MEAFPGRNHVGKEGADFFSTNCVGGKNKSCTLYKKINSACQEKRIQSFECFFTTLITLERVAESRRAEIMVQRFGWKRKGRCEVEGGVK
jgi:hypothetical protein